MLKIKFNINKFTIIFLRRFEGKNEHKRISFSLYQLQRLPSFLFSLYSVQHLLFLLFFLVQPFFLFLFFSGSVFSAPFWRSLVPPFPSFKCLSFVSFLPAFLFFSVHVLPFFFSPKTFFSAQNNSLFSPKPFSIQPKTLFFCACLLLFYLNKSLFSSNLQ